MHVHSMFVSYLDMCQQVFITVGVCNSHVHSFHTGHLDSVTDVGNQQRICLAVKRQDFAMGFPIHLDIKWLCVQNLLSILTTECLCHTVQMASIETIWELHTLTV